MPNGKTNSILQTKDFECPYLEKYTVCTDGRLIHHKPLYDCDPPGTEHGSIDTNFHGLLRLTDYDDVAKKLSVFVAKFTDGNLVNIEQIE